MPQLITPGTITIEVLHKVSATLYQSYSIAQYLAFLILRTINSRIHALVKKEQARSPTRNVF